MSGFDYDQTPTDQLLQKAKDTHKETTQHARHAEKVAQETLEIANKTAAELYDQGKQLDRIHGDVEELDVQIDKAQKTLRQFYWCGCCVGFRQKSQAGKTSAAEAASGPGPQLKQAGNMNGAQEISNGFKRVGQLEGVHQEVQDELDEQTRQQDTHLAGIGAAVDGIQQAASAINQELGRQARKGESLLEAADDTYGRVQEINKHTNRLAR